MTDRTVSTVEQLARAIAADLGLRPWDQLSDSQRDAVLVSARFATDTLLAIGWTPPAPLEWGTRNATTTQGRAGRADEFILAHDDFTQAETFAKQDPNEQIVVRRRALPAGPWITYTRVES